MTETKPPLILQTSPNPLAAREIWQQLFCEDQSKLPPEAREAPREIQLFLYDPESKLRGGLLGGVSWGSFFIRTLWIDPAWRGRGEGRRLMETAEDLARKEGLNWMIVETADFNAPEFYKGFGFKVKGKIEGFPVGHTYYYLAKQLTY